MENTELRKWAIEQAIKQGIKDALPIVKAAGKYYDFVVEKERGKVYSNVMSYLHNKGVLVYDMKKGVIRGLSQTEISTKDMATTYGKANV